MTTCDADRLFIKHQKNQLVLHCTGTDTDDLNVNKIRLELTRTIPTLTLSSWDMYVLGALMINRKDSPERENQTKHFPSRR